jgi:hypothetical protein
VFESTIFDALERPLSSVGLDVTRALARMRPHKHVVCVDFALDVEDFARAGRCKAELLPGLPAYQNAYWSEDGKTLLPYVRQGWRAIAWEGSVLEVLTLTWGVESPDTVHWVISDSPEVAQKFIRAVWSFDDLASKRVLVFEQGSFNKSAQLGRSIAAGRFEDLVLPAMLERDLRSDTRRFFERRAFYEEHRLPWKRGLLLVGPPGNGKTQTIRALLNELGKPVLYVRSFEAKCDRREANIRTVFQRARKMAPMVLVLEDIDCLIDETSRSALLNELDGLAVNDGLLTLATTNHPEKLDRSIVDRPSRFDRKLHFPLPGETDRRRYLEKWNAAQKPALQLTQPGLARLVERTKGFTFAYLKELMLSSALRWADEGTGSMDAVAEAVLKVLSGEMASSAVLLGPLDKKTASIGFAEATRS